MTTYYDYNFNVLRVNYTSTAWFIDVNRAWGGGAEIFTAERRPFPCKKFIFQTTKVFFNPVCADNAVYICFRWAINFFRKNRMPGIVPRRNTTLVCKSKPVNRNRDGGTQKYTYDFGTRTSCVCV